MSTSPPLARQVTVPCTITVNHTWEALEAHVELENDVTRQVGDRITVHGQAVTVRFGETITVKRMATLRRASLLERIWVRVLSWLEIKELYEVSFSPGSLK